MTPIGGNNYQPNQSHCLQTVVLSGFDSVDGKQTSRFPDGKPTPLGMGVSQDIHFFIRLQQISRAKAMRVFRTAPERALFSHFDEHQ